jgi:biotin-[acetyl-CoA-carboxylase] ligase BirA-like protein
MILPGRVFELSQTASTQNDARNAGFGIFWTGNQTQGRGRYERQWFARPGEALAVSICFEAYRHHMRPYLIGMAVALVAAEEFDLQVQWPNDLVLNGKKVAGILTEVYDGLIIVGLGLNLSTSEFPEELSVKATSLEREGRSVVTPQEAFHRLVRGLESFETVPLEWSDLAERWALRDQTPGKRFLLSDGRAGSAVRVTEDGSLLWTDGVNEQTVTVGEALWGS